MKIIKNKCKKSEKFICEYCGSELELTLKDINIYNNYYATSFGVHNDFINYYKCPCCYKENYISSDHSIFKK